MNEENRRIVRFDVPSGFILQFAGFMQAHQFENIIAGAEDDDVIIFVSYQEEEQGFIDAIQAAIEKFMEDETDGRYSMNG